jgi:hypothetical protein
MRHSEPSTPAPSNATYAELRDAAGTSAAERQADLASRQGLACTRLRTALAM